MSGISLWSYFSGCITNTSNTFVINAAIFGKVYFPRLVIPLSVIFSNIIRFGIQFGLLLAGMIWYHFHKFPLQITVNWLWIPVLVSLVAGIGLGLGIIVSSLTTKYRDLSILIKFIVQLLMYVTPIGYPMSFLAHSKFRSLIELNPLTGIMESFRFALFGKGALDIHGLFYSVTFMLVTLIIGLLIFSRVERTFMDTV
jgi:lipopolysaccharide transport system permease protein